MNELTTTQGKGRDGRFLKGVSGNPSGMQKGTKQRATQIKDALYETFFNVYGNEKARKKLEDYAKQNPYEFLSLVVKLLPKEREIAVEQEMSVIYPDEKYETIIERVKEAIAKGRI